MRSWTVRRIIQTAGLAGIVGAGLAVTACGAWPTTPSRSQPTLSHADVASFVAPDTGLFLFPPFASSLLRAHAFNTRNAPCEGSGVAGIASSFDGVLPDSGSGQISMNGQMTFTNCFWNGAVLQGDPNITLSGQFNYVNSLAVTPLAISLTSGIAFTYRNVPGRLRYNCTGTIDGDTSRFRIAFSGTITVEYPIGTPATPVPCPDAHALAGSSPVSVATPPSPAPSPSSSSTVTVGFNGLAGDGSPFTSYTESGFTVLPASGSWTVNTSKGKPAPYIEFPAPAGTTTTAGIRVTAGGSLFAFKSVDICSRTGDGGGGAVATPYTFVGLRNFDTVFSVGGVVPYSCFATPLNLNHQTDMIDTLLISLSNPAAPCCSNLMGLDNIVVTH